LRPNVFLNSDYFKNIEDDHGGKGKKKYKKSSKHNASTLKFKLDLTQVQSINNFNSERTKHHTNRLSKIKSFISPKTKKEKKKKLKSGLSFISSSRKIKTYESTHFKYLKNLKSYRKSIS
jgi:hypothetical protein